jgi:hypothetical protein
VAKPTRQSKATSASSRTGAPVLNVVHRPISNLSPPAVGRRPAKVSEIHTCESRSRFTQKMPLARIAGAAGLS